MADLLDPDAALARLVELLGDISTPMTVGEAEAFDGTLTEIRECVDALVDWRGRGGFLPSLARLTPLREPEPVATPTTEGEGGDG